MRLVRDRADKLHDRLADGGLENTVALIGKLGLSLSQCFAGRSAVDGQQGSDFDILFSGLPRLMMRAPIFGMNGSGSVKVSGKM